MSGWDATATSEAEPSRSRLRDVPTRPIPLEERSIVQRPEGSERPSDLSRLREGDCVGRYSLLSPLGQGGMGVVYKAYDPQLDRSVALKLLRRRELPGVVPSEADLHLLREAQTLARLAHPNVVAVHDAGLSRQGVFIVMDLCDGQTLGDWLMEAPRAESEIVEVFLAAGRGLAAAHAEGLVHQDFKPSNVLVGADRSVRVLDFGLAHMAELEVTRKQPCMPVDGRLSFTAGDPWQEEAAVMGTPAYMAPEQLLGGRIDSRCDQYALCLCLHQALFGRVLVDVDVDVDDPSQVVLERQRRLRADLRGSRHRSVSARVRRALERGLALEPVGRFETMAELIAALEPSRPRSRSWIAASTLVMGFGAGGLVFDADQAAPCRQPEAALEDAWSPVDRRLVEDAYQRTGHRASRELWGRVDAALDGYAAQWVKAYEESCQATFVRQQQSEAMFDRRMGCLQRHRSRLTATVDALAAADTPQRMLERSLLPFTLPPLAECEAPQVLMMEALGEDAPRRARIAMLRDAIDRAKILQQAGDYAAGLELMREVVQEARRLDHPSTLAEALECQGALQAAGSSAVEAERTLREAIQVAAEAHEDRVAAMAWTSMIQVLTAQQRTAEGAVLALAAEAAAARAGGPAVRGRLLANLGELYSESGDHERALALLREALGLLQQALGPEHVEVARAWLHLGLTLVRHQQHDQARPALARARALLEGTLGEAHPMTQAAIAWQCEPARVLGREEAAQEPCARAQRTKF